MFTFTSTLSQVPMATKATQLIIPMGGLGFAIGMVDSSVMPELGNLVDLRHSSVYGGVYAIGDVAFCVGFAIGPALSGSLVKEYGFQKMLVGVAVICLLYCPLLLMLKDPPSKTDQEKAEQEVNLEQEDRTFYHQPYLLISGLCLGRRPR